VVLCRQSSILTQEARQKTKYAYKYRSATANREIVTTADGLTLVDAHVHIYECFDVPTLLDAALVNFRTEAARRKDGAGFAGVLLLTESRGYDWFSRLRAHAQTGGQLGGWRFELTDESCSLRARRNDGALITLVAGRQVATAEDLEVLALCTDANLEDGLTLTETVEKVRQVRGLPTIPWGAGKWLGSRGSLLTTVMKTSKGDEIFLGDNSGRPIFWKRPFHFELAEHCGIRILPGSDPLPFRSEQGRPGSFGLAVGTTVDLDHPASILKQVLRDPDVSLQPYGRLESAYRFLLHQVTIQLRKRYRKIVART